LTWDQEITSFLQSCQREKVKMILVGGGAVNFHGYQRHSTDLDFWIEIDPENLSALNKALRNLGFPLDEFPSSVGEGEQNISLKFSPDNPLQIELITSFSLKKSFSEVWEKAEIGEINGEPIVRYRILPYEDLIDSKIIAGRPKDLLDIQELQKRKSPE
tara:strand:+ start:412 stop:888 length:477 start_codon:yes stop_codon:yes gene_type:complete